MKTLCLVFLLMLSTFCWAAARVDIYRFDNRDSKNLPADLITGNNPQLDNWVRDENPWPQNKRVLFLAHGFPFFAEGKNRFGLTALAVYYSSQRKVGDKLLPAYDAIYLAEYQKGTHLYETGAMTANIVHNRTQAWPKGMKCDVFAHSMGGLMAASAIECSDGLLGVKNMGDRVAHFVTMGTPRSGFPAKEIDVFLRVFGYSPEVIDMDESSLFLTKFLNTISVDKPKLDIDYYALVGTCSYKPKNFLDSQIGFFGSRGLKNLKDGFAGVHDGLVNTDSAGYDLSQFYKTYKKEELSINHDAIKSDPTVFTMIDKWMADDNWFGFGQAITSPIIPPKAAEGLPILFGKNAKGAINAIVNYPWVFQRDYSGKIYNSSSCYYPKETYPKYVMKMSFAPYSDRWRQITDDSTVHHVEIFVQYWDYLKPDKNYLLSSKKVIPTEIFIQKPVAVYKGSSADNMLVFVWYIDRKTFIAEVYANRAFGSSVASGNTITKNYQEWLGNSGLVSFFYSDEHIDPAISNEVSGRIKYRAYSMQFILFGHIVSYQDFYG